MKILKFSAWVIVLSVIIGSTYFYSTYHIPSHYRTSDTIPSLYNYLKGYLKGYHTFNPTGLHRLNAMASGYLDFYHIDTLRSSSSKSLIVLNGLADDVTYINGKNLKFFCLDSENGKIRQIDRGPIKNLVCGARRIASGLLTSLDEFPHQAQMESSLLAERNISYHTPFPSNWLAEWSFLDQLIDLFENVNENQTLYFHCGHGQGRTTTMLTLWDIYNNAQHVSIEDIVSRQFLLGGEDLMDVKEWKNGTWPVEHLTKRRNLVLAFYKYMNDKEGYGTQAWSEWIQQNQLTAEIDTFRSH